MTRFILFLIIFVGPILFLISIPLAKLEICRTYYPEVSWYSCLISNYGLPPRGTK